MNSITRTLSIVFIIQCALVFLLNAGLGSSPDFSVDEPLLSLDLNSLESFEVEDSSGEKLTLTKQEGKWILPELHDFPASQEKWDDLKGKLADMKKGWPVATTSIAAKQLKLVADEFERKLTFKTAAGEEILYFGTSPGYKKVHAKLSDDTDSFSVNFSTYEASTKASDWTDKSFLKVSNDVIAKIIHPKVTLVKGEKSFTLTDIPEGKEANASEIESTAKLLSNFTFLEVLGVEDKDEYHLEDESGYYEIEMKDGKKIRYDVSLHKDGAYAVLKSSNAPYYFKITKLNFERVRDLSPEKLLKDKESKEEAEAKEEASQNETTPAPERK